MDCGAYWDRFLTGYGYHGLLGISVLQMEEKRKALEWQMSNMAIVSS